MKIVPVDSPKEKEVFKPGDLVKVNHKSLDHLKNSLFVVRDSVPKIDPDYINLVELRNGSTFSAMWAEYFTKAGGTYTISN